MSAEVIPFPAGKTRAAQNPLRTPFVLLPAPLPLPSPAAGRCVGDLVRCRTLREQPTGRVLNWRWERDPGLGSHTLRLLVKLTQTGLTIWVPARDVDPIGPRGPRDAA